MSDCSSNAMKPKEPPKTGFEREYLCQYICESCATNLGYLVAYRAEAEAMQRVKDVEQRCQQLEQVAREMLGCVFGHRYWPLRHKLEALGVSLDD